MKQGFSLCALLIAAILLAFPLYAQSEENTGQEESVSATATVTVQEGADSAPETAASVVQDAAKEIAIYGEVQSVNSASNSMSVQYYDYDTDEEKGIDLGVNNDTKFENAALLNDIKKGDWVDVTYIAAEGKNLAKLITVEKEEEISDDQTTPPAAAPDVSEP